MVIPEQGESFLADLVDISAGGAGIEVPSALEVGAKVSLLVDADAVPDPADEGGLPSLPGRITSVKRLTGSARGRTHRLGIAFFPLPDPVENRILGFIASGTGSHAATPPPHALATTPRGRVVLAHIAMLHIDADRLIEALEMAELGLRYEPHNRTLRALVYRVHALRAVEAGAQEMARNEIAKALALEPDDRHLLALAARISPGGTRPAPGRGLLSKLFGKH